jgi:hypothetical protein
MEPTRFRKALQANDAWSPFIVSAALGVIALVTQFCMALRLKAPPTAWDPSLIVYFCSLPSVFMFEAFSHLKTREHVKELEARIERLETDKAAS